MFFVINKENHLNYCTNKENHLNYCTNKENHLNYCTNKENHLNYYLLIYYYGPTTTTNYEFQFNWWY